MLSVPLKLPALIAAELQGWANRMGSSRAALARALLTQGLERLASGTPLARNGGSLQEVWNGDEFDPHCLPI